MKKIINALIYGVEVSILIALIVLEYLSGYRAGVMRHLYFKKMEYLSKIYTQNGMMIHSVIVLALFIGLVLIYKNRLNRNRKLSMVRYIIYSIILVGAFYLPYLKDLKSYAYILMFIEILIGTEAIKIIFINKDA
ncbi:hypothetical protein [Oceanirhabdus sp. W0125-5]|uniref:hypothetical protein n=1 Tax=Oceanirhabdus sp. W0125-5 TaxID=2999116 RepID=UPI0022F340B9|nr:hypothetical protein [Oceanirhabdus sp. W0125-5]WBW96509.1 hypothetical protein OW730_22860 [Oceanirhabdus sp. W0125-5]